MTSDPLIRAEHVRALDDSRAMDPTLVVWLAPGAGAPRQTPTADDVEVVPRVLFGDISWSERGRPHIAVSTRPEVRRLLDRFANHPSGADTGAARWIEREARRMLARYSHDRGRSAAEMTSDDPNDEEAWDARR